MRAARRVRGAEPLDMGLGSRVVPAPALADETQALVAELAGKPPVAVRLGKAAFQAALETPLAPGLEAMQAQLSLLNTTEDAAEGVGAFLAKRPPQWKGR